MVTPGHIEPTCLWVAVALPPGNRKSAVQSAVCAPLIAWERQAGEAGAPEIAEAESTAKTLQARANSARAAAAKARDPLEIEAATREAADLDAQIQPPPVVPQLWTSDATPERLGDAGDQGECMAGFRLSRIVRPVAGRYSRAPDREAEGMEAGRAGCRASPPVPMRRFAIGRAARRPAGIHHPGFGSRLGFAAICWPRRGRRPGGAPRRRFPGCRGRSSGRRCSIGRLWGFWEMEKGPEGPVCRGAMEWLLAERDPRCQRMTLAVAPVGV